MVMNREPTIATAAMTRWTGFLLARAHQRAHALFHAALAPLQLTPKSFGALSILTEHGPLSQAALGEMMRIDRTTMVTVVDGLERTGYVQRGRNSADRRVHSLEVTPAGEKALRAAERIARRTHDELLAALSPTERDELRALLARVAG
jgi:MarR family transcriptional regulator, lower aerobic nicotinate degradation pathway regulator